MTGHRIYEHAELYDRTSPGLKGDIEFYLQLAREARPPVLDLGCGSGRVAIPIARAGIPVVGIDSSPAMLALARRKADGVEGVRWLDDDMRRVELGETFGLVIIAYRSFQHLPSSEDRRQTLVRVFQHLRPGGRLAMDILNPTVIRPLGAADGGSTGRKSGDQGRRSRVTGLHPIMRAEMEELLLEAGFEVGALYGGFDRSLFNTLSMDMVWVATKP